MAKRRTTSERRGVASIALVIVLVIAEFAILALVLGGSRDQDLTVARVSAVQAFYAAEAGMNMAMREVMADEDYDGNGEIGGIASTASTLAALHNANIAVSVASDGNAITLTSQSEHAQARRRFETSLEITETASALEWTYGAAVTATVKLHNHGRIDAFDSRSGTYDPWTYYSGLATVASNTTTNNTIELTGSSRIIGDVLVGPGGNHAKVIKTTGSTTITGSRSALTQAVSVPAVTKPSNLPASLGNSSFPGWGSGSLSAGTYHYNNFTVNNDFELTINGQVTIVCDGNFTVDNSGRVQLASGATLAVYAERFQFIGNARLNMTGKPSPSRVHLYQLGSSQFRVDNSAAIAAAVIAPNAEVWIPNNGRLFGIVQAAKLFLDNSGQFTQDIGFDGGVVSGSGGGGTAEGGVAIAAWRQLAP